MHILSGQLWLYKNIDIFGNIVNTIFCVKAIEEDLVIMESRIEYYEQNAPTTCRYRKIVKKDKMDSTRGWTLLEEPA